MGRPLYPKARSRCRTSRIGCWSSRCRRRQPKRSRGPIQLGTDDVDAYLSAVVDRETRDVAEAPPGQRNHRLNRAAFKLGQFVGAGLLEETVATAALVAAGLAAGPGERKIRSTVSRGLDAGKDHPRRIVVDTTA